MTTRRRLGLAIGTAAALAAILEAAVGVSAWRRSGGARPPERPRPAVVREWAAPVGDLGAALDDAGAASAGPTTAPVVDTQIGTTPTGLPLYRGPRGGTYHVSKGGRKIYHTDRGGFR